MRDALATSACRVIGAITGRLASRQDTVPPPNPGIVVLRRCCLGDVLASTAVLDALRRRFPLARIDYATTAYAAPALAGNPDISRVIAPTVAELRRGDYDVAITLERSPVAGMLPWLAGIPLRVGPNSLSRGFAHTLRVACPPDRSEAEIGLECAAALGVSIAGARPKFCPSAADMERAGKPVPDGAKYVAMAPGGGINPGMQLISKRWPADRFAAVADRLSSEHGLRTVLIGGNDDQGACAAVMATATSDPVNLCGETSFGETAAVIQRSQLFVGNDSAPLHLAAAVGRPWVGIFGPSDPVRHRPLANGEVVAAPIPRGAYRNGYADVDCIDRVQVGQVVEACSRVLAEYPSLAKPGAGT